MNHPTVTLLSWLGFLCIATASLTGISFAEWPHWRGPSTTGEWNPASFPEKKSGAAMMIPPATARYCTPLHATARHCSPLLVEREGTEQFICWTP